MTKAAWGITLALALALATTGCDSLKRKAHEWLGAGSDAPDPSYLPPAPRVKGPALARGTIPKDPPFLGKPGVDRLGYPRQRPDQVALVQLLRMGRFDELERFVEYYQSEFEGDFHKEYWPLDALSAFAVSDPELKALLDEWVRRSPKSFAPWAARAAYRTRLGWYYRGEASAKKTSHAQFTKMAELHELARADFREALKRRPKLVAAYTTLLDIASANANADDDARLDELLDRGLAACRLCYEIRASYLEALKPRWGGSYEKMAGFTEKLAPLRGQNPKLKVLSGFAEGDRCDVARREERLEEANEACDRALALGDDARLLRSKARVLDDEGRLDEELRILDRALLVSPQHRKALLARCRARWTTRDYLGSAEDLATLRQLLPSNDWVFEQLKRTVERLRSDGARWRREGKDDQATQAFELALRLAPTDRDLRAKLGLDDDKQAAKLLAEVDPNQDDFESHLEVDHALASLGRFGDVVAMWDGYIEAHPDEARAYYERGGAKYLEMKPEAALQDMDQGCKLGHEQACRDALLIRKRRHGGS